tara:strand:- start:348 stop:1208 length:861 start_codon:yes stop_codon:yes gene_type:complete
MNDKELQRLEFLKEIKGRELMRKAIRKAIHTVIENKKQEMFDEVIAEQDEIRLRAHIRNILSEAATADTDPAPHRSTGINVLSDLLKKIISILEDDFKILTTSSEQRQSFRAHIIHGVQNALAPLRSTEAAGKAAGLAEVEIKVGDEADPDKEAFIDVTDSAADDTVSPEEEFGAGLEGADQTGRNMAYASFKKIEQNIIDAYELLHNDSDREVFYDYLITNLKLYFDKFEDELASSLQEPTTPEYDQATDDTAVDADAGISDEAPPAEDDLGDDLGDELGDDIEL